MSDQFYNPYHFIPFNDNPDTSHDVPYSDVKQHSDVKQGKTHITHDRWKQGTLSGAIYVALTNHSDLIVGGERKKIKQTDSDGKVNEVTSVKFYRSSPTGRRGEKQLSIPGNSLRGMIASTAEIISDSSMRVLGDDIHAKIGSKLKINYFNQLGEVVKNDRDELYFKPLCCGDIKSINGYIFNPEEIKNGDSRLVNHCYFPDKATKKTGEEYDIKWEEILKVFIEVSWDNKKAINNNLSNYIDELYCYHGSESEPKYLYIEQENELVEFYEDLNVRKYSDPLLIKQKILKGRLINSDNGVNILYCTQAEFEQCIEKNSWDENNFIRYIPYFDNSRETYPENNKEPTYVTAIPYSKISVSSFYSFKLDEELIHTFEEYTKNNEQDIPKYWKKLKGNNWWKVQSGDILYFQGHRVGDNDFNITALSYQQQLTNEKIPKIDRIYDIIRQTAPDTIYKRYLPWGKEGRTKDNAKLTAAEQIFGVVTESENEKGKNQASDNLASRVRFYDAILLSTYHKTDKKTLTLSTPKPPSASMYLRKDDDSPVTKKEMLQRGTQLKLNGRKRYLQHKQALAYNSGSEDMKTTAEILPAAQKKQPSFGFCIEFDNLTHEELDLLLVSTGAARHRDDVTTFQHQLGMGKPYGFGKVKLDILGVFIKEPQERYQSLASSPVYSKLLHQYKPESKAISLLRTYADHAQNPSLSTLVTQLEENNPMIGETALAPESSLINSTALTQVKAIADETNFNLSIHYPLEKHTEEEAFKWFANNDHKKNHDYQALGKLPDHGKPTPLKRNLPPDNAR